METLDSERVAALMREAYLAGDMRLAAACGCHLDGATDRVWPNLAEARAAIRAALANADPQRDACAYCGANLDHTGHCVDECAASAEEEGR